MSKLPGLSHEHIAALAQLANRPEFKAFESLCKVEENNIIISSFKINSNDPDLRTKKAHTEGRLNEIRKILKTFSDCKKAGKE